LKIFYLDFVRPYMFFYLYVILCFSFFAIGYFGGYYIGEKQDEWFQRSGSLIVAISIYAEISIYKTSFDFIQHRSDEVRNIISDFEETGIIESINDHQSPYSEKTKLRLADFRFTLANYQQQIENKKSHLKTITKFTVHFMLFFGTTIWGYGDLIYLGLNQ